LIILWGDVGPPAFQKNLSYKNNTDVHLNSRVKEIKEFKNVDILFLGSSRSYRHYDPRIFAKRGYSSFNLGSNSQTFLQTEVLVKRHLRNLNLRLVVIDIYPGMFNSDGVESSLDIISNDQLDNQTFKMVLLQKNIKVFNTFIYSWYRNQFHKASIEIEKRKKGYDTYISGGYVEKILTYSHSISSDTINFNIKNYQLDSFLNIIEYFKQNKTKFIIVQSPRHKRMAYKDESKLDSIFKLENVEYHNYSYFPGLDDTLHFYDSKHLNQNGVKIFDEFLIDNVLQYKYLMP
tara:strand:+ start:887 stop:1756 length:870 start_codon:yes stop_codon:yes gene_type:complete